MDKTALIILNYNNYEDTINCIESVEQHNTAPIKMIVIDNGSPRPNCVKNLDAYLLHKYGERYTRIRENSERQWPYLNYITLLTSTVNDGYACGNNKGLKLADMDPEISHIMILNNDILFISDIIPPLLNDLANIDDCAIISPLLYQRDGHTYDLCCARRAAKVSQLIRTNFLHYWNRLTNSQHGDMDSSRFILMDNNIRKNGIIHIDLPSGSCMLIKKNYFKSIGWFDPNTFLYFEEDILYQKIKSTGRNNYLDMDLKCIHLGAGSTKQIPGLTILKASMISQRHYVLNYTDSSWIKKTIFKLSQRFYLWSMKLQKRLQGRHI